MILIYLSDRGKLFAWQTQAQKGPEIMVKVSLQDEPWSSLLYTTLAHLYLLLIHLLLQGSMQVQMEVYLMERVICQTHTERQHLGTDRCGIKMNNA